MINKFITDKYEDIMLMSKKICRSHVEWEEVGHYCIEKFMIHERAEELIDANRAMQFISGIMHRSFHSSTSQYHKDIRQKGRMHTLPSTTQLEYSDIDYNLEQDILKDLYDSFEKNCAHITIFTENMSLQYLSFMYIDVGRS